MNIPECEYIERAALEDLHEAASDQDVETLGLFSEQLDTALVSIAANLPPSAIVINRAMGVGLGGDSNFDEVRSVVSAYREQNVERFFVQVHPDHQPQEIPDWLQNEGLIKARGWQKFERQAIPVSPAKNQLSVEEIGPEHGKGFGRILCNAFDLGDQSIDWLSRLPGRSNWHIFMSFSNGQPAGVGALYVKDDMGWTDFGATDPDFRRQGSQSAVMAARLSCALDLGCKKIFTCTGVQVPGDPQHSYSNILKAGFKETYVRENYQPG